MGRWEKEASIGVSVFMEKLRNSLSDKLVIYLATAGKV
jgi:hypothetical protein